MAALGGCTAVLGDGNGDGGTDAADGLGMGGAIPGSSGGSGPGPGAGGAQDNGALHDVSRLTRAEYAATVSEALGTSTNVQLIPEDGRIAHFTSNMGVTPDPVHPYLLLAEELSAASIPSDLSSCSASDVATCFDSTYRAPLERLFRRPLADSEVSTWTSIVNEVTVAGGDDVAATRSLLAAALVSPDFLFRSSPSNSGENAWARRVAEWLGYALWDAPPDEELRDVVANSTGLSAALQAQAGRLATDERAIPVLARFFGQWLDVDTDLRRDEDDDFATSPDHLELLAFVEQAIETNAPVTDFIGGNWGVVHPDNAEGYDVTVEGDEVTRIVWPEDSLRRGLLGQELMAGSTRHPDAGRRPIFRGLLVRRALLCDTIPAPDPELVALAGEIEDRTEDGRCASCHRAIDPIGYAFAAFDPESAESPPEAEVQNHAELAGTYATVAELLEAVASSRAFAECFSRQWLSFFLESELNDVSDSWVVSLADSVQAGASLPEVIEETAFELAVRSESALPWCEGE